MNRKWRIILEGPGSGYYNMAADEAVLLNYPHFHEPTLRIYGWDKPFVSIGYNQKAGAVLKPCADIPFVRRITGGGAILHHDELTYSVTRALSDLPSCLHRHTKNSGGGGESYEIICRFLIEFYLKLGLEARFAKDVSMSAGLGHFSDFCFSSYERYDLVIEGKKIGGNAQRRKKDIIFQHGSIPLTIDIETVKKVVHSREILEERWTSLAGLRGNNRDFYELQSLLTQAFKDTFEVEIFTADFHKREKETIGCLIETKYHRQEWNSRK